MRKKHKIVNCYRIAFACGENHSSASSLHLRPVWNHSSPRFIPVTLHHLVEERLAVSYVSDSGRTPLQHLSKDCKQATNLDEAMEKDSLDLCSSNPCNSLPMRYRYPAPFNADYVPSLVGTLKYDQHNDAAAARRSSPRRRPFTLRTCVQYVRRRAGRFAYVPQCPGAGGANRPPIMLRLRRFACSLKAPSATFLTKPPAITGSLGRRSDYFAIYLQCTRAGCLRDCVYSTRPSRSW